MIALAAVAISTALLGGCVRVKSVDTAQLDGAGAVRVTLELCQNTAFTTGAVQPLDPDGCAIRELGAAGLPVQVFVTYVVPEGVGVPAELTVAGGAPGDVLIADDDDTAALLSGAAAPTGYRYATYRSVVTPALGNGAEVARAGSVVADFDVAALHGDFAYAAAVSWRFASADPLATAYDPARAVQCGVTGVVGGAGPVPLPDTSCSTATVPAAPGAGTLTVGSWTLFRVPTNRLQLAPPDTAQIGAGRAATVTFSAASHLAGAATSVPLEATTTIPGATVSAPDQLAFGGSSEIPVELVVPASTPAGSYAVTLTAGSGTGLRTAQALVAVVPADPGPPEPTATPTAMAISAPAPAATPFVSPQDALESAAGDLVGTVQGKKKTTQLRKGAATVPVKVSAPGTVRVTIQSRSVRGKPAAIWAVGSAYAKAPGSVDVTLKPTDAGRALFKSGKPVKGALVVRFAGSSGKYAAPSRPITLG